MYNHSFLTVFFATIFFVAVGPVKRGRAAATLTQGAGHNGIRDTGSPGFGPLETGAATDCGGPHRRSLRADSRGGDIQRKQDLAVDDRNVGRHLLARALFL